MFNVSRLWQRIGKIREDFKESFKLSSLRNKLQRQNNMELLQPYGKYILIGLAAIAVIAILIWISIVVIVMRNTQGIPMVISKFFELIIEDKIDELYNSTTDNFRRRISKPKLRKLIKNKKFKQYKRTLLAIPQMNEAGNNSTIDVTLILNSGREIPLQFNVVRQNKEWKIDFLEIA